MNPVHIHIHICNYRTTRGRVCIYKIFPYMYLHLYKYICSGRFRSSVYAGVATTQRVKFNSFQVFSDATYSTPLHLARSSLQTFAIQIDARWHQVQDMTSVIDACGFEFGEYIP